MTFLCSDILDKHPRRSCPILLRRYVFTLFRQENDLSTDALEMEITELSFNNLTASAILVSRQHLQIYCNISRGLSLIKSVSL